ncbi:uncharacterized protein LOC121408946 [Lytechinus variegatus]|uniref:uncharacterized protein LOC121408946 n=1 Tax=Lytechinus variegatus TaxID=7654 RepID=UPI001BB1494F|nr:uncharacterized protein LOC121408946 [Lytechinus variegatus]XP_041456618.1 uncharacterized protein LOC121408946 [Lytechinus variegatus]
MSMPSFTMGQTENEDFPASASTASQPLNFVHQDFTPSKVASQSPHKQKSPGREQSGRPSTPFPENELQFVPTYNTMAPDQPIVLDNQGIVESPYLASEALGATSTLNEANLCQTGQSGDVLHHQPHQQHPGPLIFSQQQAWPPESHKLYYSQSLDLDSNGMQRTNPFATGQRSASCDASHGSTTPTSPVEKEERIPNSAVRRSRVWKYGRRSSGNHSDRQPFTFSVTASQAGAAIGGIEHSSARFFGKRSMSSSRHDDAWSSEPSTKQFISEERMTAEMHNLSLDGVVRQPLVPLPSSSTPSSLPSSASPPSFSSAPSMHFSSTSGQCNHGNSDLLRHHRCHHDHRTGSRSYAEAVLADIERRLDDDSDDEGVEEDMPPNQGDGHRLEMTPQLVTALKSKGTSSHVLPQDIVKKIVSSPCMDLVLWRPLSIINPRGGPDPSSSSGPSSPSSTGSELTPIMEVEVERERAEASSMMPQPQPYEGIPPAANDIMQEEVLPDYDEDMDL